MVRRIAERTETTQEAAVHAAVKKHLADLDGADDAEVDRIVRKGAAIGQMLGWTDDTDPTADLYGTDGLHSDRRRFTLTS